MNRNCWERIDDWIWIDGHQREAMQQAMLNPPENETIDKILNRYAKIHDIIEKLPNE